MKCKICGSESGKYPLCRVCNIRKEKGEITKCTLCGNWHLTNAPCVNSEVKIESSPDMYLYNAKYRLISKSEQAYAAVILTALPANYHLFPQVNLASFIVRTDNVPFQNELFRNVDFLVTDDAYKPLLIIEINDQTHLNQERKERDEKVKNICEEAGIPIIKFWTTYGINEAYIRKKLEETLASLPVQRIHHFDPTASAKKTPPQQNSPASYDPNYRLPTFHNYSPSSSTFRRRRSRKSGCYVATCVYGSYDCPEVWVLRRYRDTKLATTWYGRLFIKLYYSISPTMVKIFGKQPWFHKIFKSKIDKFVIKLKKEGFESSPYQDEQ